MRGRLDVREIRDLDEQLRAAVTPPTPPPPAELTPEQREERDRALAARWNDLLAHEQQQILHQAEALDQRLADRAAALRDRIDERVERQPTKPKSLAMLTGRGADYEAALQRWAANRELLERTAKRVYAQRAVVSQYMLEPPPGCPSRVGELAARRVNARYPELAEHVSWRQAQTWERAAAQFDGPTRHQTVSLGR